ncbi:hypothetical protein L7F22_038886 [Adiantum nelumboides]|nr:hypothetical protein [Adiantum nelumboides]
MNSFSSFDDIDFEEQEAENDEKRIVLSQRVNGQNMSNNQLQRYATVTEEHPSLQAARIQSKLQQKLGPEYVSYRAGPGGLRVSYLEANKAIELANEIFGHDSWSSEIIQFQEMLREKSEGGKWTVSVMCTLKITIRSGAFHQDCGFGNSVQSSLAAAVEKAYKESSTDAMKRCLRLFGNATGNCLYDRKYLNNVAKMKTPNPAFNPQTLLRAEDMDNPNNGSTTSAASSSTKPHAGNSRPNNSATPPRPNVIFPQAKVAASHRTGVNGATSAASSRSIPSDAARQERLQLAAIRQEELRRKKLQNGNGQQTSMAANDSLPTLNSNSALPYTVQHPEGDEYDDEFGDITPSQLNVLSKHDRVIPSNESTLVHDESHPINVKLSPSRAYSVGEPTYQRGGVVGHEDDVSQYSGSYGLPSKRPRNS